MLELIVGACVIGVGFAALLVLALALGVDLARDLWEGDER